LYLLLANNNKLLYDMEEFIQNYLESNNCKYIKIKNREIINHIYNLYKYGIDERDTFKMEDSIIDLYYGEYYKITKNYKQMKKYYLIAIEKGNTVAINNLGFYYQNIEKDYDQMKKYYLMAIEKDNTNAMNHLGFYYQNIEKDYEQMKKYYLVAIEKGNQIAMYNLGLHYQEEGKDYEQMKKNYLIAIEKGHGGAMNNLGFHYQNVEKDYEQMKKYYLMAIEKGYNSAMKNLGSYYQKIEKEYELMKKYYFMAIDNGDIYASNRLEQFYKENNDTLGLLQLYIKIDDKTKISHILVNYCNQKIVDKEIDLILLQYLNCIDDHDLPVIFKLFMQLFNNQIDLLEAHFKYSENGLGYEEAKQDFLKQLSS